MSSASASTKEVLFLCTANYYRSRFAEAVFAHQAAQRLPEWTSSSRALAPSPAGRNPGNISVHTADMLEHLNVPYAGLAREPLEAVEADFSRAQLVIALHEREHRPMMEQRFPSWAERISYWNVADAPDVPPHVGLPRISERVSLLISELIP